MRSVGSVYDDVRSVPRGDLSDLAERQGIAVVIGRGNEKGRGFTQAERAREVAARITVGFRPRSAQRRVCRAVGVAVYEDIPVRRARIYRRVYEGGGSRRGINAFPVEAVGARNKLLRLRYDPFGKKK